MKALFVVVLVSLLVASGRGDDLAASFKQAAALGDAQEKERAMQAYLHLDLMPYYQQKYSPVFQSCLKANAHPDPKSFSFVAAIGKDGHVLRLYVDHETDIYSCARETLQKDEFPHPPISPYYLHVSMSFSPN